MPQPRKPLEMLELSGAYRADRHGQRRGAPKSERPIGDPPPHLAPDEAAAWREFVRDAPAGVLTSADRLALEMLARLVAKGRRPGGLLAGELAALRRLLGDMGATPASRSRVLPAGARRGLARGQPVGRAGAAGQGLVDCRPVADRSLTGMAIR